MHLYGTHRPLISAFHELSSSERLTREFHTYWWPWRNVDIQSCQLKVVVLIGGPNGGVQLLFNGPSSVSAANLRQGIERLGTVDGR